MTGMMKITMRPHQRMIPKGLRGAIPKSYAAAVSSAPLTSCVAFVAPSLCLTMPTAATGFVVRDRWTEEQFNRSPNRGEGGRCKRVWFVEGKVLMRGGAFMQHVWVRHHAHHSWMKRGRKQMMRDE